jgi:hypothetical protein
MSDNDIRTLYIVVREPHGGIGRQQIGQALVEADFDATLTKLALRQGCEPLASFTIYSRRQAAAAIQELEDLGDVDVDPRDFDPKWFDPLVGLAEEAMAVVDDEFARVAHSPHLEVEQSEAGLGMSHEDVRKRFLR